MTRKTTSKKRGAGGGGGVFHIYVQLSQGPEMLAYITIFKNYYIKEFGYLFRLVLFTFCFVSFQFDSFRILQVPVSHKFVFGVFIKEFAFYDMPGVVELNLR